MVGTIILWVALGAGLISARSYHRIAAGKKSSIRLARNSYAAMAAAVVVASALMLLYILRHQFEYAYVWGYSSRSLPLHLLITTFWAGQEGSFLFWALCGALIGLVLMAYTHRRRGELEVMTVYVFLQSFLLLLLIVKSPFQFVWSAYPDQFVVGGVPADGRGLNPLLQNVWMVAHPPVLFVGFAAMAVPFAFAVAALWRRSYHDWISNAVPWVIFGTIALGTGIILGGYWAYGVLGWGGWWGWDPVENSSLIPWLVGVILIHTLLVQKRTGGLSRTNFLLAVFAYVLVVYSTFLTRSGILGESSVHSFVDPGSLTYTLLVVWIVLAMALGVGMVARSWKELKSFSQQASFWSRESFLAISSAVMGASALVILFGTSWPILSRASLEPAFYDKTNLPIVIALGILLGLSLLVQWRGGSAREVAKNSALSFILSVGVVVVLALAGVDDAVMLLFAFASLFAFFVNVLRLYALAKESLLYAGGALAHIGLTLLFLGIIGSGRYGEKQTASLTLQEPKEVLGHTLTYEGTQRTPDGKWKYVVRVEKDGTQFVLEPVMFESDYSNSVMRNPDYASSLTGDFYLEPVSLEQADAQNVGHELVRLKRGEPQTIGDIQMTFVRFDMSHEPKGNMLAGGKFAVGAVLEVKRGKDVEVVIPVTMYQGTQPSEPRAARTKDGTLGFELLAMNVDSETQASAVELNVTGLQGADAASRRVEETLVVEASVKPFIGLIWAAALLVIVGLLLSLRSKTGGPPKGDRGEKRPAVADQFTQRAKKKSNGEQVEELTKGT